MEHGVFYRIGRQSYFLSLLLLLFLLIQNIPICLNDSRATYHTNNSGHTKSTKNNSTNFQLYRIKETWPQDANKQTYYYLLNIKKEDNALFLLQ